MKWIAENYQVYNVANTNPFFIFLFHRFVFGRVHFTYSTVILLGSCMVMWTWGGREAYSDVIVVMVKVSRRIVSFSLLEIDSADTKQPSNEEICMDKSHLLPNNPVRH
jgi:hypothetical protein